MRVRVAVVGAVVLSLLIGCGGAVCVGDGSVGGMAAGAAGRAAGLFEE